LPQTKNVQRYFIKLAYKGTNYHGWQIQENALSVQAVITSALATILQDNIEITGCGRTDTGVHAQMYFAHFDTEKQFQTSSLTYQINNLLPKDIVVFEVIPVIPTAHARFDAVSRSYEYIISNEKNPFSFELSYYFRQKLNIMMMNRCGEILINTKDFKSFCKTGSDNKTTICEVKKAYWEKDKNNFIFHIQADRFLRNMVRAVVGTMIEVGMGKINEQDFQKIVDAKDRKQAKFSAPAEGLHLTHIEYPKNIFIN
jgi:tRNA pseudouridine38-40 synthase